MAGMKKIWQYLSRKAVNLFWLLPVLIVLSVTFGFLWNISSLNEFKISIEGEFYDLKDLCWLEIFPAITLLFSIYLIVSTLRRINAYKKTIPGIRIRGLIREIKYKIIFNLRLPKRYFIPLIAYWMLFFWSIGWGLYICALWSNYSVDSNVAEILGYSAMASLDLFLLDINGDILDNIGGSLSGFNGSVIKGGIVLTSIFAAFCSFSIIIKLFLNRLLSTLHASKASINDEHNHLYIFFGINKKSLNLASTIKENDKRSFIIHVEYLDSENADTDGVNNIINFISPNNSKIDLIDFDDRTLYLYSSSELSEAKSDANLWSQIGLEQIERLIKSLSGFNPQIKHTDPAGEMETLSDITNQIHVFFLSENRDKNVSDSTSIVENFKILSNDNQNFKNIDKKIYCQTRRDAVTSVIEDSLTNLDSKIEVQVIDESVLAVERLKENVELHPINFVDIEVEDKRNIGTIKDDFTSLIIGFGETGRDAFRFLYEFGAFLSPGQGLSGRSGFCCHIVDGKMSEVGPRFVSNNPSIFKPKGGDIENVVNVSLHQATDKSAEFYNLLDEISSTVNYIVVAAGDDETNITIAVNVLKYIRRNRDKLGKLKILVRAYGDEAFSHIAGIVSHYNEVLKDEANGNDIYYVFGQLEDIFSYKNVVGNSFKNRAVQFYESYDAAYVLTEEGQAYGGERTSWHKRRKRALTNNRLSDIEDLRRKESQDVSNAWHALTKVKIINTVLTKYLDNDFGEDGARLLANKMFDTENEVPVRKIEATEIYYPRLNKEFDVNLKSIISTLLTNVAKTEHLRWVAAHEALGYVYHEKKDKVTKDPVHKWHSCMIPWEQLEFLTQSSVRLYDYLVVETTLKLLENTANESLN